MLGVARRPDGQPEPVGSVAPELRTLLRQATATVPSPFETDAKRRDRPALGTILAAALLHLGLATIVALSARPISLTPSGDDGIEIELTDSAPPAAASPGPEPSVQPAIPAPVPPLAAPTPSAPDLKAQPAVMMHAARILSGHELADPRNRQARKALAGLPEDERLEQLCDTEAMAQLHAWKKDFRPDMLVAYAMAEMRLVGTTLHADGGAFRSRQDWFAIAYDCEAAPDLTAVRSFAFRVGGKIPQREWRKHDLTLDDAD